MQSWRKCEKNGERLDEDQIYKFNDKIRDKGENESVCYLNMCRQGVSVSNVFKGLILYQCLTKLIRIRSIREPHFFLITIKSESFLMFF